MSDRKRVALLVYVDLDPIPGPFHTENSALNNLRGILEDSINRYNPTVAHAPESLQPYATEIETNMHADVLAALKKFRLIRHGPVYAGWEPAVTNAAWTMAAALDDTTPSDTTLLKSKKTEGNKEA